MRCGICNKLLIFTHQYQTVHQHTICKECVHRHDLNNKTKSELHDFLIPEVIQSEEREASDVSDSKDLIKTGMTSKTNDGLNLSYRVFRLRENALNFLPLLLKTFAIIYFIMHTIQFISQISNYRQMDSMQVWFMISNILYLFLFPLLLVGMAVLLQQLRMLMAQITRVTALSAPVIVPIETEVNARRLD